MSFVALEKLHRLHDGYRQIITLRGQRLLLLQDQGQLHLIATRCPHAGSSLEKGTVRDGCIKCPKHGIVFDLESGRAQGGEVFASLAPLTRYQLAYQGNEVGVYVE